MGKSKKSYKRCESSSSSSSSCDSSSSESECKSSPPSPSSPSSSSSCSSRSSSSDEKEVILIHRSDQCLPNITVKVNRTVFIDAKFGTNTGRVEDPTRPFRTINQGIAAIINASPRPSITSVWVVSVNPGTYIEDVTIPSFVNLQGAGQGATIIIGQIKFSGQSVVSSITQSLSSNRLPAIDYTTQPPQSGVNGFVLIQDVAIEVTKGTNSDDSGIHTVISATQTIGINGLLKIIDSTIFADISNFPGGQSTLLLARDIGVDVQSVVAELMTSPTSLNTIVDSRGAKVKFQGESITLNILTAFPSQVVTLFSSISGSSVDIQNHEFNVIEQILLKLPRGTIVKPLAPNADAGEVIYLFAASSGSISAVNSIVDYSSVNQAFRVLAETDSSQGGALINISNVYTKTVDVPFIRGDPGSINYLAFSAQGNVVSGGGNYTNIVTVSTDTVSSPYFVQDNDEVILVTDPVVEVDLEDPVETNQIVLYKGKRVIVKNISQNVVTVKGKIFDVDPDPLVTSTLNLNPLDRVIFQNNGIQWFILSQP